MIEPSEDERRGREKFVRERSDYGGGGGGDRFQPRRDFGGGDRFGGGVRRDYNGVGGIKRVSTTRREEDAVSSQKRNRIDTASDTFEPQFLKKEEESAPFMLTFKKFLATLDDSVSDEEAINKYIEYKVEFKKQECERYFQTHKEEEWFRHKYHPEESKPFKENIQNCVNKRLEVFNELCAKGVVDAVSLDYTKAEELIRMMDTAVIKLEDGTDEDVEALKNEPVDDESVTELAKMNQNTNGDQANEAPKENGSAGVKVENSGKKTTLHKTCSIFFRNIPKDAKISNLETVCKQYPGFLRIGFTDINPETKSRKGYVTYRRDVNIKEIFWTLRNVKLMDQDVGAAVNRDLRRRIRTTNGLAMHRPIVQNDIRQAAKLIVLYDFKASLFLPDEAENEEGSLMETPFADLEGAIVRSKNPLFADIIDFLVDEGDAEEELLLGYGGGAGVGNVSGNEKPEDTVNKSPFEIDQKYVKALDKLLLYLRIVHSVDYYNACEYSNEDTMPHRVGILHVRGKFPSEDYSDKTDGGVPLIPKSSIDEYISAFNDRLNAALFKNIPPEESELEKLGKKDPEKAVQDFISANCVEQAKDKWLCPLSGKKFKGPEFIHKHLYTKYQDKIDEVRNEAMFYNNFLVDPNRPHDYVEPPKTQQQLLQSPPKPLNAAIVSGAVEDGGPQLVGGGSQQAEQHFDRPRTSNMGGGFRQGGWSGGGDRFGGGGGRGFGGGGRGPYGQYGGNRDFNNRQHFNEQPFNELTRRPAPSYRDLDAPEEIA